MDSSTVPGTHFDVLVLSTDLAASIAAAALAKAGLSVLHVDENGFYGGAHASLTPDELLRHPAASPSASSSQPLPPYARQYSIALAPAVINATGPLITSIVASGVSRYGGYKLLDALAFSPAPSGPLQAVPGSKEDVFRSKDLTLPEKHHLMKFLLFAAAGDEPLPDDDAQRPFGDYLRERFKLGDRTADAVVYAIAQCSSSQEAASSALARTRAFIRSSGRYGNSPFLLPYYGGLGEIAQGFCRTCAVHGGVYILGHKLLSLSRSQCEGEDERWAITLDGVPDTLTASVLLSSRPESQSEQQLTCIVALTAHPLALPDREQPADDALVVFPPSSSSSSPMVRALVTGPKSMSAPPGNWVVHAFSTSSTPDLQPHLNTLLGGHPPTFTASFTQPPPSLARPDADVLLDALPLGAPAELGDAAAVAAENAFWAVVKRLGKEGDVLEFWPEEEKDAEDVEDEADW